MAMRKHRYRKAAPKFLHRNGVNFDKKGLIFFSFIIFIWSGFSEFIRQSGVCINDKLPIFHSE